MDANHLVCFLLALRRYFEVLEGVTNTVAGWLIPGWIVFEGLE
jgi:hypothetical protein